MKACRSFKKRAHWAAENEGRQVVRTLMNKQMKEAKKLKKRLALAAVNLEQAQ